MKASRLNTVQKSLHEGKMKTKVNIIIYVLRLSDGKLFITTSNTICSCII